LSSTYLWLLLVVVFCMALFTWQHLLLRCKMIWNVPRIQPVGRNTHLINLDLKSKFVYIIFSLSSDCFFLQYLPSINVTLINIILPLIFGFIIQYEQYSESTELFLNLSRCVILRLASLVTALVSLMVSILILWELIKPNLSNYKLIELQTCQTINWLNSNLP